MQFLTLIASILCVQNSFSSPLYLNPYSYDSFSPQFSPSYSPQSSFYGSSLDQFSNLLPSFSSFRRTPLFHSYPSQILQTPPSEYNFFAESPYSVANRLIVVPLIVVPQTQINMVTEGEIKDMPTQKRPTLTVQTSKNLDLQCTPAVRVVLEQPIVVTTERSKVLFPAEMSVIYNQLRVPIRIGAVIAPVLPDVVVSPDAPLSISVVYAIPGLIPESGPKEEVSIQKDSELNKPLKPKEPTDSKDQGVAMDKDDYVNNDKDVTVDKETQAVIVETPEDNDVTTEKVSTPSTSTAEPAGSTPGKPEPVVAEEDEEADKDLVNRNPPLALGGFQNSKESNVLTELREQSKKERLRT